MVVQCLSVAMSEADPNEKHDDAAGQPWQQRGPGYHDENNDSVVVPNESDEGVARAIPRGPGFHHDHDHHHDPGDDELEPLPIGLELEGDSVDGEDWSQIMEFENDRNEENPWQAARNVVPQEQADRFAPGKQDCLQLSMDFKENEDKMWNWINSRSADLKHFADEYANASDLVPKPNEVDEVAFREEFGRDLIEFLDNYRQRNLAMRNNPGMPSNDSFSNSSTSQSKKDRKGKRPSKYNCGVCGQPKKKNHICRPTRKQIIKTVKDRLKKDSLTRPPKKAKLGRSDSTDSKEYRCNNCGKPKRGHVCQVPDVIGRIAQRVRTTTLPSGPCTEDKMIEEAIDDEEGLSFDAAGGRLIVNSEVGPVRDNDQRPIRYSVQAEENILLLQRREPQVTKYMMGITNSVIDSFCDSNNHSSLYCIPTAYYGIHVPRRAMRSRKILVMVTRSILLNQRKTIPRNNA